MSIRKIALLSLLTAFALGLFALELLILPFPLCPAAKIGLANTVTLFMLMKKRVFTVADCAVMLAARCLLAALITGRLSAVAFSLCGGIAALLAMTLIRVFTDNTILISIAGAVFHNIAQMAVSVVFYGVFGALYTLPSMLAAGLLCGTLTGACVMLINKNRALSSYLGRVYGGNDNGKREDREDKFPREKI